MSMKIAAFALVWKIKPVCGRDLKSFPNVIHDKEFYYMKASALIAEVYSRIAKRLDALDAGAAFTTVPLPSLIA